MNVATKKVRVEPVLATGLSWEQKFLAAIKKELGLEGEITVNVGANYSDEAYYVSVDIKDGWNKNSTIFDFCMTQFPGSCGVIVAHSLADTESKYPFTPFFLDIVLAIAWKMKYGLVMLSHQTKAPILKAAAKYGFAVTNTLKNPNSGNRITLISMEAKKPKHVTLLKLVEDVYR